MQRESAERAARVGIVGAGQLARMTLQSAIALGVDVHLLATSPDESAARVCANVSLGAPASYEALAALAEACDAVTFDHELVDVGVLRRLEQAGRCIRPSAETMAVAQNKGLQRARFAALGLPVPAFQPVGTARDLVDFGEREGWPVVAKAQRGGYDGRGVWVLADAATARDLAARAIPAGVELLAEAWVPVDRELAVLIARRPGGDAVTYPLVETVQIEGICRELLAPAPVSGAIEAEARRIGLRIADGIGATGILAVELFLAKGRLLINELAARPHNSGHFSIEGCVTSQFENHLRAVLDWPLGSTALRAPSVATVNLIPGPNGWDPLRHLPEALGVEGVSVHLYQKGFRPGRKLGHVTALGDDPAETRARARRAAELLAGPLPPESHQPSAISHQRGAADA
jgi:5-(carboxyamino)imidazole ribonucleotide synthase